ncbi:MAG: tRNA (adenosine(37)-N6)-threonylcarbamoyltransferase complex ATPase subunit type 1 TsaE [Candidatus Omnitrophota bacterium]|nr:MAG: tRNA (adenosine(37)-N6)-threonylcarbamoyltransferase complex ATPase subunit type 1 TsaE [Candidatus Omnitrophota bacterium]
MSNPLSFVITTDSAEHTLSLGRVIARFLKPNTVICLSGQLGTGKTTLVKGIAAGLGINSDNVNSPSYMLIKEYNGKKLPLFHFDLYRIDHNQHIAYLEIDDYFKRNGVLVIEWAEKANFFLPEEYLQVNIRFKSINKRIFRLSAKGRLFQNIVCQVEKKMRGI